VFNDSEQLNNYWVAYIRYYFGINRSKNSIKLILNRLRISGVKFVTRFHKRKNPVAANFNSLYAASQWTLIWAKFKDHKLALAGLFILALLYFSILFAPILKPYDPWEDSKYIYSPPTKIHIFHNGKIHRPFVYKQNILINTGTFERLFETDYSKPYPILFFVKGFEYKWLGLINGNLHLFGTNKEVSINLMGTDILGRDCFSRNISGLQISLTVGLFGVLITFILGCIIGGLAGYYGGVIDNIVQRIVEFISCIPTIPMWMALGAVIPQDWGKGSAPGMFFQRPPLDRNQTVSTSCCSPP